MSGSGDGLRSWLIGGLLAAVAVAGVLAVGRGGDDPLSPRSDARLGTSALVALARRLGADVSIRSQLPDLTGPDRPDVLLVLNDGLDGRGHRAVRDWVKGGGIAVVTDPASDLVPDVEFDFTDVSELHGTLPGDCGIAALDGIDLGGIAPHGGGVLYRVPGRATGCLHIGRDSFIVAQPRGEGTVVAIGGSGLAVNEALAEGENAPVMAALVAPRSDTRLVVLEPGAGGAVLGGGRRGLAALISPNVKRALAQLGIAFVVYALWRARRLGRPVAEPQPVAVAASELVSAVGNLLDRSGSPQHAADLLRGDLRRFLADRVGVPAALGDDVLAEVVAGRTGVPVDQLRFVLADVPVTDDAGLLALAGTIDHIREEVLVHV